MNELILVISFLMIIGCSTSKTACQEVVTYHELTKQERSINGRIVKEKFTVDRKTDLKPGSYELYDLNYRTLEQGNYENGVKTGIWKIWQQDDEIFIEKDYDNGGRETALIEKYHLKYPMILVEERDTFPQGLIIMELLFDNQCILISLNILEGIDEEFDHKISNEYWRYTKLCNKYDIPIEECNEKRDSLVLNFHL
jgi:hypothetical protein